jgi:hypothetical protein
VFLNVPRAKIMGSEVSNFIKKSENNETIFNFHDCKIIARQGEREGGEVN